MIKNKIQFAVLTGGNSSRFCGNKLNHIFNGKTILQQTIENVKDYLDLPILMIGKKNNLPLSNIKFYEDIKIGSGPLRGIYTALTFASAEYVFIIAGDMPFIQSNLVDFLISNISSKKDVIIPIYKGFYEPLFAIYHTSLTLHFETFLKNERYKISDALKNVNKKKLSEDLWRRYDSEGISFYNINYRIDLPQNNKTYFSWTQKKEIKNRENFII